MSAARLTTASYLFQLTALGVMSLPPFREMQQNEEELIRKLLEPAFPGRSELLQQMETAKVRVIDDNGSLEFLINSVIKAEHVKYAVPTEGRYADPDGMDVHVLLHVIGNKAVELQIFRDDSARVQTWPDAGVVEVFAPD